MNTLPARILPHYTRPTPDEIPDLESAGNSSGFYSSIGAEPRGTIAPLRCTLPAQAAYDATGDMAYGLELVRGVAVGSTDNRFLNGIPHGGREFGNMGTQTLIVKLTEDPTARITDRTREGEVIVVHSNHGLCRAYRADRHPHVPVLAAVRLLQGEDGREGRQGVENRSQERVKARQG